MFLQIVLEQNTIYLSILANRNFPFSGPFTYDLIVTGFSKDCDDKETVVKFSSSLSTIEKTRYGKGKSIVDEIFIGAPCMVDLYKMKGDEKVQIKTLQEIRKPVR